MVVSASRSFFEEMDLLAGRAMPVTPVLRTPLSCPPDSPNITVLERVLSYSGSPLTEYEVAPRSISRVLRISRGECEDRITISNRLRLIFITFFFSSVSFHLVQ